MLYASFPGRALLALASAATLAGCASLSPDAGFRDVEKFAAARIDQRVQWNRTPEDERAAAELTQSLVAQPLTADAAVQVALLDNRGLQATYAELGIAQGEVVSAGRLADPLFSARRWAKGASFKSEIGIEFDFLSLLLLPKKLQMMKENFEQTKLQVGDEIMRLAAATRAQYYRALAAQQTVSLQQAIATSTEAASGLAVGQYRAGNLSLKKQAKHELFYAEARSQLVRAKQQAANERERLSRLMGLSGAQADWKLPGELPQVPATQHYENLEATALEQRLDVQAARQETRVLAENLGITESTRFIDRLTVGWGVLNETNEPRRFGPSIAFDLPIFDQGAGRVARDDARLRRSAERLADLAVEVRAEVRERYNDLLAAHDLVAQVQKSIVPLRKEILAQTQLLYNGMLEGIYDLLDSYRENALAGQAAIDAVKDYWIAYAELERAVGGKLPAPVASTDPALEPPEPGKREMPMPGASHND